MAYSDIDSNKVLNKEGVLALCTQIKDYIDTNSGTTYTAGKNITIDANNTINAQPEISAWLLAGVFNSGDPLENDVVQLSNSNSTTDFINALQAGKLIYITGYLSSWSGLGTTLVNLGYTAYIKLPQVVANTNGYTKYNLTLTNQQNWRPESGYYYQAYENTIFGVPRGGLAKQLAYYSTKSGLSAYTIWGAIDELAGNVTTKLTAPTAPTTDGTYKLTSTITSGSPTYSWEADSGSTYTLPTASTDTLGGVKVDGSTITITDGVISATSSGGASYTAGDGIDIDANGVISKNLIDWSEPLFSVISSGLVPNFLLGKSVGNYSSVANLATALKQNKIAQTASGFGYTSFSIKDLNDEMGTNYAGRKFSINFTNSSPITNDYYNATSTTNINSDSRTAVGFIIVGNEIWCVNGGLNGLRQLFGFNLSSLLQLKTYNATNYTNSRLDQAIYQLDTAISSKQDAIIPTAPTTDGDYVLKVSVSSGTPTYSWVSVS